jgi:predicted RND superfamily exporter protein
MFDKLATFAHSNRRRLLFAAIIGVAIAGVFGAGVSSHLSPYGANDPATQSVQATDRFEAATGRQIDPGVIALVSSGDVRHPAARQRVANVAAELSAQPDVASVASFYTTHNPAMVARDGRSTYVVAYFKALSDKRLSDDAKLIESRFSSQPDVRLGVDPEDVVPRLS